MEVLAPSGSESYQLGTTNGWTDERTFDLTEYAGETVSLRFATKGTEASFEDFTMRTDTDGDSLWDHVEEQTWYHPKTGNRFTTEATSVDTDGDGLDDDEEVRFAQWGDSWEIVESDSDPSRADSDGDGLSDAEELNGWVIHAIDDHERAKKFANAIGDDSKDHTEHVSTPVVTSDPTQKHSDNDGLNDSEEENLGTDPKDPNTDGDNLDDGRERQINADPTMFDIQPPSLNVHSTNIYQPSALDGSIEDIGYDYVGITSYSVRFSTQDRFGLSSAALTHDGKVTWERTPEDRDGHAYSASYRTDEIQTAIDSLTGAATRIVLEDAHGNTRSKVVYQRQTAYVQMAEQSGWEMDSVRMAIALGMVTGFGAGAGEMAGAVKAMIEDFEAYAKSVAQIVVILKERGFAGTLEAIADGFEQQMKLANPYDFQDQRALYEHFRTNYYLGMLAFEATLALAGTAAVSAAKHSTGVAQLIDTASDTRIAAAARFAYNGYRTLTKPTRWMKGTLAAGLSKGTALTIRGANRIIDSSTIGKALKKKALYQQLDVDVGDLSKREQEALNDYLDETGRNGVWLANRYGDEFREMLTPSCRIGSLGAGTVSGGSLGPGQFHSVRGPQAAMTAGNCGPDIDGLDTDGARRIRELQNRGVLDDDDVRQLLQVIDEGSDVEPNDVHYALWSARILTEMEGQNVKGFQTAKKANLDTGEANPPFTPGTIVTKFEVGEESPFQRVVPKGREKPGGRYMTLNEGALAKRNYDPHVLESDLALPETPYYRYDVEVPEGTNMKYGRVNSNYGESGGGNQVYLDQDLPKDVFKEMFTNRRMLDG